MTIRSKTRRSWRRAGRCLGLILGLIWLAGCAAYSQNRGDEATREFDKLIKESERQYDRMLEGFKAEDECYRHLHIGMTTTQVVALKTCKDLLDKNGRLSASSTVATAAGTMHQVPLGTGYLYFQNYVLVTIQR